MFFDNPYFENVASDFITLSLVFGGGSLAYRASHRRSLLRFFECADTRSITFYLSSLAFKDRVALDLDRALRGYHGPAVPGYEAALVASAYRVFLAPVPGLKDQKGFLRFLRLSDLDLRIVRSPRFEEAETVARFGTLITIGSDAYNQATRIVEAGAALKLSWIDGVVDGKAGIGISVARRDFTVDNVALVQKVFLPDREQWAFEVAGITEEGTSAAYLHLLGNWPELLGRYGHGPGSGFCQVLEIGDEGSPPKVIHQFSEYPTNQKKRRRWGKLES